MAHKLGLESVFPSSLQLITDSTKSNIVTLIWQCEWIQLSMGNQFEWIFSRYSEAKEKGSDIHTGGLVAKLLVSHTNTRTHLMALCPGLPRWAGTRKVKPMWILLEQEIVSGSGISWAICKSVPRSRQISTPAPHYSVFYRPDALPAAQPTVSKHWRQLVSVGGNCRGTAGCLLCEPSRLYV